MSKQTRTWRYQRDKDGTRFVAHSRVLGPKVTVHCAGGDLDYAEPDMRLIAAAPRLLEALKIAAPIVCSMRCPSVKYGPEPWTHHEDCIGITAAIREAEGEE